MADGRVLYLDLELVKLIDSGAVFAIEWAEKVSGVLKQYSDEAKIIWVTNTTGYEFRLRRKQSRLWYSIHERSLSNRR